MKERIAEFIREKAYKPMSGEELVAAMGVAEKQQPAMLKALAEMEADGLVVRTRTDRYGAPERMNLAVGRLQGHPKGFAFLIVDEPGAPDVFVGRENQGGAWHNDRVIVRLMPPSRGTGRLEGEVIRILKRANQRIVGTYEADRSAAWVKPDEQRLTDDILIPRGSTNGARSGEKVVVQIVRFPDARRAAEGRVIERLGQKGDVGVDILSVIRKFNLPEQFPAKVLAETAAIADEIPAEEYASRRDLRALQMVTIDGADAKDLDDAVSVERIAADRWRLGVHIADVSYYVREGSAVDAEAYKRATSIYLPDRVVPMLPPKLSNDLCSLNPQADRLAMTCLMVLNEQGKVESYEIFPSVIRTTARMTYPDVKRILTDEDAKLIQQYEPLVPMFREMQTLMGILKRKRMERGALDFDLPETKVELNEHGFPVSIQRQERSVAEMMIEEFMLAANETVAAHCSRLELPCLYRVHEEPAEDKVAGLRELLGLFGYDLRMPRGKVPPRLLQGVTEWARGRKEEAFINTVLLRTMRQAQYSEANDGHFGLAAEFYCHFTSPIRRYPDLVVHRILRERLTAGAITGRRAARLEKWMPEAARHCSERERVAVDAERETVDLKKAEFMMDKVGESFEGIISGVSSFGFFVQLPNTVEGLVHVSTLNDDYYHFHERYYALIGERTRRRFRLGDAVTVRCVKVEIETRTVDFVVEAGTEVQKVTTPVTKGRGRAPKKAAASGEEPRKGARTKDRGRQSAAEVQEATTARVQAPVEADRPRNAVEPTRTAGDGRRAAPETGRPAAPETGRPAAPEASVEPTRLVRPNGAPRAVEPARTTEPSPAAEAPRAAEPAGRRQPAAAPQARSGEQARSARVDMWGIPVKSPKVFRAKDDEDPTVINPYALTPPPRRERNGGAKVGAEAPAVAPAPTVAPAPAGVPAPATADEAAAPSPAAAAPPADGEAAKPARPRRRTPSRRSNPRKPKADAKPAEPGAE